MKEATSWMVSIGVIPCLVPCISRTGQIASFFPIFFWGKGSDPFKLNQKRGRSWKSYCELFCLRDAHSLTTARGGSQRSKRLTACHLRVTCMSPPCRLRATPCCLRVTPCQLHVTACHLRVTVGLEYKLVFCCLGKNVKQP